MNKQKSSLKKIKALVSEKTSGFASNVAEAILLILSSLPYLLGERSLSRAMENIGIILDGYDPNKLRKSFFNLRNRGYLDKNYQLTKQGWEKIKSLTPVYTKPQHWDGQWYLVIFDIPESHKQKREILRNKLKDLGFGMLQKSVWLSPYNYLEIISKLISFYRINLHVLTAVTSRIGEENDLALAKRVWPLDKINKAYQEFIEKYKKAKKTDISGRFFYLSILKQDPQLPIELLPSSWVGQEAIKIAKRLSWI